MFTNTMHIKKSPRDTSSRKVQTDITANIEVQINLSNTLIVSLLYLVIPLGLGGR